MKQGISNEGVAVATSNKYGLVLPDNSTIVSNNGVISAVQQDLSIYATKEQLSTTVNSALNEKANLSDLANYVPLATYNALLARVEALENKNQ